MRDLVTSLGIAGTSQTPRNFHLVNGSFGNKISPVKQFYNFLSGDTSVKCFVVRLSSIPDYRVCDEFCHSRELREAWRRSAEEFYRSPDDSRRVRARCTVLRVSSI